MNTNFIHRKKGKADMDEQKILELYNAIEDSHFTVAITGAGISLAAGGVTYAVMKLEEKG